MDLVFEYEHAYGRIHPHEDSWAKFLAGIARTARFSARDLYAAIAGPAFALSSLSSEGMGQRLQAQHLLEHAAWGYQTPVIVGPDGA